MAATSTIALGLGVGEGGSATSSGEVLLDADFVHKRFSFRQRTFGSEAEFLAATGGIRQGGAINIGPTVIGPELLANGGFDSSVAGWSAAGDANITPIWAAGQASLSVPGPTGNNRFGRDVALAVGKAYRFGARPAQAWSAGGAFISFARGLLNTPVSNIRENYVAGQQHFGTGAAELATQYIGVISSGTVPRAEQWDDFTVREAVPVVGHNHQALGGSIAATTPATASGNKVLFQADDNGFNLGTPQARNRIRLVWDADRHFRLVVTLAGSDTVNLDLGVVAAATPFTVGFSAAADSFKASLDAGAIKGAASGAMPGLCVYRIGRSQSGEAWDGGIGRVTLFAGALDDTDLVDPARAFAIHGDSTARGDNGTPGARWWELLAAGYGTPRSTHNAGIAGQDSAGLRAGLLADIEHRRWTTIMMDRPNTGETASMVVANLKAAIANLLTDRWLVLPPVADAPDAPPGGPAAAISGVQQALLADPAFAGHTFAAAAQASYLAALSAPGMRTDGVHFSDAGQAIQAAAIRTWLDERGW